MLSLPVETVIILVTEKAMVALTIEVDIGKNFAPHAVLVKLPSVSRFCCRLTE